MRLYRYIIEEEEGPKESPHEAGPISATGKEGVIIIGGILSLKDGNSLSTYIIAHLRK